MTLFPCGIYILLWHCIVVQYMERMLSGDAVDSSSLKTKYNFDDIFATGCTESCQHDKFRHDQ